MTPPSSGTATTPLVSIGTPARRWLTMRDLGDRCRRPHTGRRRPCRTRWRSTRSSRVGEQQRGVGLEAVGGGHDRRQRIDVGDDGLGGVVGLGLRFGDHGGDHVADEPHPVGGEDRSVEVGRQHREALHGRHPQVVAGVEHGDDAWHRRGLADVDRVDRAVGDGRPHQRRRRASPARRDRRRTCPRP